MNTHDNFGGSPERFGYSWSKFSELTPEQRQQFLGWTKALGGESAWRGKTFLDVGCGAGRNSYWPMTLDASGGVAIDIDDRSLALARHNLAGYENVTVVKCSAYDIPWKNKFDIVFSIGVIHHLEKPELALGGMIEAAKPGGRVLIWVYGRENLGFFVSILDPLRRFLFSRLPIRMVDYLAYIPAAALWLALRMRLGHLEYLKLLRGFSLHHLHHIVFDQMLPRISNYWTQEEVAIMLARAGLSHIQVESVNDVSWAGVGTKIEKTKS